MKGEWVQVPYTVLKEFNGNNEVNMEGISKEVLLTTILMERSQWLRKIWTNKLMKKEKLKYCEEIEQYKLLIIK